MVLEKIAEQVNQSPKSVIGAILAVTILMFGILFTAPEPGDPSQAGFIPENETVDALTDIGEKFQTEYPVITLIRADDVVTSSSFVDIIDLQIAFLDDEKISESLIDSETKTNSILALPNLLAAQFNESTNNLTELKNFYQSKTDAEIKDALRDAKDNELLSQSIFQLLGEYDDDASAKSTIIMLTFDNSNRDGENSVQALERISKLKIVVLPQVIMHSN